MRINHNEKGILTGSWINSCQNLRLLHSDRDYGYSFDGGIFDMSSKQSGNLLVTNCKEGTIEQISISSDELKSTTFFEQSRIGTLLGIHVTHYGNVLVGSYDKENKKGSIIRLSQKGTNLKTMYTESNALFRRITENVYYDILILTYRELLVLDREGTYRFRYSGPTKININFRPRAVVCSVSGQIFIADRGSNCIHLLDRNGTFLQFLLRENNDLEYPRDLAFSDSGILWVGYSSGKIVDYNCYICLSGFGLL